MTGNSNAVCVDASVVVKWLLPEIDSAIAKALLRDCAKSDTELRAPTHLQFEAGSAVYKRLRAGDLTAQEADLALETLWQFELTLVPARSLASRALSIADQLKQKLPYDSFCLALGEIADCEVWTADARFHKAAASLYPRLKLLSGYQSLS
ncbi:MAG: type II toxin-antitoxin system VapC family toxin [Dehalococcoidia bacterium]